MFEYTIMRKYILLIVWSSLLFACGKEKHPINSYYKNIPIIQGLTRDEKPKFFNVKIDLGYENGNKKIQTEVIKRKEELTDIARAYLSSLKEEQFLAGNQEALKESIREKFNEVMIEGDIIEIYLIHIQVFDYR